MHTDQNTIDKIETDSSTIPRGIGGWLIIPAIGLVLSPIKSLTMLIMGIKMIQSFTPELLSDARLWISGLIDVTLIIATLVVTVFFFKKRRIAVQAIIGLMAASIVASAIQTFLNMSMIGEVDSDTIKPIVHACVFGAIWIPYFLKSKRVKNTFVK